MSSGFDDWDRVRRVSRLIAAAPDLLKALRYARLHLDSDADTAYIDAVIAKAEGSDPMDQAIVDNGGRFTL